MQLACEQPGMGRGQRNGYRQNATMSADFGIDDVATGTLDPVKAMKRMGEL